MQFQQVPAWQARQCSRYQRTWSMCTIRVRGGTLIRRALSQIIISAPAACPVVIGCVPNQVSKAASHSPFGTWVVRHVATGRRSAETCLGRSLSGAEQVPQLQPRRING